MMRKKTTLGFALTCVLIAAAIAFTVGYLIAGNKVKTITETATSGLNNAQLEEVESVIKENYLGTINEADLVTGMCKGYVEGLGDSSVKYVTASEYESYNKSTPGETIIYRNFGKGIGYMQFLGFTDSTKTSFSNALNDFNNSSTSKVNMLVFDLRNCSTGDIGVAAQLLDMLLPEGETIAGVDKEGNRTVLYTSDQSSIDYDIAVLVNGNTSGVAEIFASTLNAYGKAIIVGTTTAGDCAQTDAIQLKSGDYILIPNLYYVTKGQQTYSNSGIVPTNVVELSVSDQKAFDSSTLDLAVDQQFLAAVKALGVNDVVIPNADTDTDTDSKTAADTDTDTDRDTSSDSDRAATSSDTDTDDTSSEELDPHWDDEEYWENRENGNDNGGDDEEEYYDDEEYYYDDEYDYDEDE